MIKKLNLIASLLLLLIINSCGSSKSLETKRYGVDTLLKTVKYADIKGGPQFEQPHFLYMDNDSLLMIGKMGHAYPALLDVDNDGLLDLLVGEFGMGKEANLLVFKNVGTKHCPRFSSASYYLKDKSGEKLFVDGY